MIKELPSFIEVPEIDQKELIEIFQRDEIREIRHFVLGPPGTKNSFTSITSTTFEFS